MGAFFGFIFGLWIVVAILSSFYFWVKKTDRSQASIVRRFTALGYGLAWPYLLIKHFTGRQQAQSAQSDLRAAQDRILGGGGSTPSARPVVPPPAPSPGSTQSSIKNPFDA